MNRILTLLALSSWLIGSASAASKQTPSQAPTTFAPVPAEHELAGIWNDPEFTKRMIGSYGFLSEAEPRMTPEEQQFYSKEIQPLLQKEPSKAVPLLVARTKQAKASPQFDFYLGTIYFQNGDLTNAVIQFQNALAKAPDFRRAQKNLAFALVREGRYQEATKPLLRTIMLGGADGKVYGLLGFAYMSQGRFASAAGAYQQATVFEPDNLDFRLGAVKCAVSTSNFDHALGLLEELLAQYPERESLWTLQANIYIQKQQNDKATISLEMLRRLGKASPQALFQLGDLYMTQEIRDLALATYLDAVELDQGKNLAKAVRPAQILVNRGAYPEARQLFTKIRSAGVPLEEADELKLLKLESRVAMGSGEGDKAIQILEQISQRDPLDGEALLLAGDYYARQNQPEKATFRYDTAAKLEGFEADAYVKQAQLLMQSQDYTKAAELLRKAQKIKPRDNVQQYLEKVERLALSGRN